MSESTPEAPAPVTPPAPVPAPPATPPSTPEPAAASTPTPAVSVDELPAWAQKNLAELRSEAAANRVKAKETAEALDKFKAEQAQQQAQQREAFAKALGLAPDEPPTAEQLAEQLAAEKAARDSDRQRARQAAVELAVFRAAAAEQVDGNALLDSRAVAAELAELDPTAGDFQQRVAETVAKAAADPRYKPAAASEPAPTSAPEPPAIPRSGGEFSGANNGPRQWTEADVQHATPDELQKAINQGLLEDMGFGPKRRSRRG